MKYPMTLLALGLSVLVACDDAGDDTDTMTTGGEPAMGGAPTMGGAPMMGGAPAMGGGPSTGGEPAMGGEPSTGGAPAMGGGPEMGGEPAMGGAPAMGGEIAMGGAPAMGGEPAMGGAPEMGNGCALPPLPMAAPLDLEADCEVQNVGEPIRGSAGTLENGTGYLYFIPENAHSLLFVFHGGGGSKEDNFTRAEPVLIVREAIARGYAVVSLDSIKHTQMNPDNFQWNESEPPDNPDVANVASVIRILKQEMGLVAPDAPIVLIGISNGGSMASRAAQIPDVTAAAIYISNARYFYEENARIPPVILLPGAQDPGRSCASTADLAGQIQAAGGTAVRHVNRPQYATAGYFTRMPMIDCAGSKRIIQTFIDQGYIRADGAPIAAPEGVQALRAISRALPEELSASHVVAAIVDQFKEMSADHSPSSDLNEVVFDFLDTHR